MCSLGNEIMNRKQVWGMAHLHFFGKCVKDVEGVGCLLPRSRDDHPPPTLLAHQVKDRGNERRGERRKRCLSIHTHIHIQ